MSRFEAVVVAQARALCVVGVIGGIFVLALQTALNPGWGPPGSEAYDRYEQWNRLWPVGLVAMCAGFAGVYGAVGVTGNRLARVSMRLLLLAFLMMVIGNVLEFWLYSNQPYGELNGRNISFMGFFMGVMLMLLASILFGVAVWRETARVELAALLILHGPLAFWAMAAQQPGVVTPLVVLVACICGLVQTRHRMVNHA